MARVPLVALERFYYDGRNVEKDEQFDAEEKDVSSAHAFGQSAGKVA